MDRTITTLGNLWVILAGAGMESCPISRRLVALLALTVARLTA